MPRVGGWFLYVIECADGSLYTGIATDPEAREVFEQKVKAFLATPEGKVKLDELLASGVAEDQLTAALEAGEGGPGLADALRSVDDAGTPAGAGEDHRGAASGD